jgi:hypothetical protein
MTDVGAFAAEEIVEADNLVAIFKQPLSQMRSEKSRSTGNQRSHVYLRLSAF